IRIQLRIQNPCNLCLTCVEYPPLTHPKVKEVPLCNPVDVHSSVTYVSQPSQQLSSARNSRQPTARINAPTTSRNFVAMPRWPACKRPHKTSNTQTPRTKTSTRTKSATTQKSSRITTTALSCLALTTLS